MWVLILWVRTFAFFLAKIVPFGGIGPLWYQAIGTPLINFGMLDSPSACQVEHAIHPGISASNKMSRTWVVQPGGGYPLTQKHQQHKPLTKPRMHGGGCSHHPCSWGAYMHEEEGIKCSSHTARSLHMSQGLQAILVTFRTTKQCYVTMPLV